MTDSPVTLVTGSRKGIGRALVRHFVERGHRVIGCSRTAPDWTLDGYRHFEVDVTDERGVIDMLAAIRKEHGRLDNLLNNAGIAAMNHALLTPLETAQRILNTNLLGTFLLCRESAKLMKKRKYGRIVNFSTIAVPLKLEGEAIYAASKAAVGTLTEVLCKELAPFGITVNAVGPTPVETDLIRNVPDDKIQSLLQRQAIPRFGTFDDVINVVDFFVAPESAFVSGQTVFLGGVS